MPVDAEGAPATLAEAPPRVRARPAAEPSRAETTPGSEELPPPRHWRIPTDPPVV
jgi:hypothetical protein